MLYDAHRQLATPGARSACPACGQPLIAKCGPIVIWHWAHLTDDCDPWAEPESQWHLGWKRRLEKAGCRIEVTMGPHRADVITPFGHIIELQARYQTLDTIKAREAFYGEALGWLYQCDWQDRIHWGERGFWWKHGSPAMVHHERPVLWDLGKDLVRVDLGFAEREDGKVRILGRFANRVPHREAIERWTGVPQPTFDNDAPVMAGIQRHPIASLEDALAYHFEIERA